MSGVSFVNGVPSLAQLIDRCGDDDECVSAIILDTLEREAAEAEPQMLAFPSRRGRGEGP
jgi:hypothetical protein